MSTDRGRHFADLFLSEVLWSNMGSCRLMVLVFPDHGSTVGGCPLKCSVVVVSLWEVVAVTVLFEHIAYTAMLPIFGGCVAALMRVADAEIERVKAIPLPPTMSTAMFRSYLTERPRQRQLDQFLR